MEAQEYNGDLTNALGQILVSWFLANPSGPTAYALGFVEIDNTRRLFYRWMHFTGGKTWLLNELPHEQDMWDGDFGDILVNSLLLANNHFIVFGGDKRMFTSIPQIVVGNENPGVQRAFYQFLQMSLDGADWGKEVYYVEKYRNHLFERYEEQFRDIYERLKNDPVVSKDALKSFWEEHCGRKGFDEWLPNQYSSEGLTPSLFARWHRLVADPDFGPIALYNLSQMWVGSLEMAKWSGLAESLGSQVEPLSAVLKFFENFNLPLLPKDIDEAFIRAKMRLA